MLLLSNVDRNKILGLSSNAEQTLFGNVNSFFLTTLKTYIIKFILPFELK